MDDWIWQVSLQPSSTRAVTPSPHLTVCVAMLQHGVQGEAEVNVVLADLCRAGSLGVPLLRYLRQSADKESRGCSTNHVDS